MTEMIEQINLAVRKLPEWPFYIVGFFPAGWLLWLGVNGGLGVEPIKELEHELGILALQFLIASLLITPLRRYVGLNLLKFRRAFGLLGFGYVCLHLSTWLALDMAFLWGQILEDLTERPYIMIGMAVFLMLIPLAVTSTKKSIRRLGRHWNKLHRLVYLAVPLGAIHFMMQERVWTGQLIIYLVLAFGVVGMRMIWMKRRVAQ